MKKLIFALSIFVFLIACVNNNSVQTIENESVVDEDSVPEKHEQKQTLAQQKNASQEEIMISDAIKISNEFYKSLLKQSYTEPNKFLHPDVFEVSTPDDFTASYKNAQVKMGKLAFVKLFDQGAKTNTDGENGKGDYCELIFDAQYKDGNLREKLIFFRKDSTQELKLLGYQYHQFVDEVKLTEKLRMK